MAYSEDEDVLDLDAEIRDAFGNVVAVDDDDSDLAIVTFSVPYSRQLKTTITNYSSRSSYTSKCNFIVFFRER